MQVMPSWDAVNLGRLVCDNCGDDCGERVVHADQLGRLTDESFAFCGWPCRLVDQTPEYLMEIRGVRPYAVLEFRCRDIGYGVEEGIDKGRFTGDSTWQGSYEFEREGKSMWLFPDEVLSYAGPVPWR